MTKRRPLAMVWRQLQHESAAMQDLKRLIRTIPDYPKKGIMFRDVTTLMGDAQGFKAAIERMEAAYGPAQVPAARGCCVAPRRKNGKLHLKTIGQEYTLEYGVDITDIDEDAIRPGERILIV